MVCNPLGKSGGSAIQQVMIIAFGSLSASTPYLGAILLVVVLMWMGAARSLNVQVFCACHRSVWSLEPLQVTPNVFWTPANATASANTWQRLCWHMRLVIGIKCLGLAHILKGNAE